MASKQIKLSKREENEMLYDDYYMLQFGEKLYAIGCVPVQSRLAKIRGKKDTYYTLMADKKGYKVYGKTHDLKLAEWSLAHAAMYDHFADTFKLLAGNGNGNKKVMDKKVKSRKQQIAEDPILKAIYSMNLKPTDDDTEETYNAKKSLSSIRPKDLEVTLIY